MSKKDMQPATSHLPADLDLQEKIKQDLVSQQQQVQATSVERVRLGSKGFTTPDGETGKTIRGIIVDFVSANMHYTSPFNPNSPTPPDCFATGRIVDAMAPDPKAAHPQAPSCAECKLNKFESGIGKAKACKNTRQLALMQEGANDESPIWVITVPPASIRYFDTYISTTLRGRYSLPPIAVVTEIFMDPHSEYASPRFRYVSSLTDEELAYYYSRRSEAEAILLQKPTTAA